MCKLVYFYSSWKKKLNALGNRFRVNLLLYAHWFMSIRIYQMKDNYISVYQARYDTSIVEKFLYTSTVKGSKTFYKKNLPYDMIFTKVDLSTIDEQVDKLTR